MLKALRYGLILLAGIGVTSLIAANSRPHITIAQAPAPEDTSKKIRIIHANDLSLISKDSVSERRFRGDVVFKQGTSLLYCDSAIFNEFKNMIEAFGHVHINQDDSIHTYSDYLIYLGNTRQATLTGNAKLTDNKIVLTGPEIQYDLNTKIGTYTKTGKLVNGKSVLTSQEGFYYAETKDVYFKKNVVIVDPGFTLGTDTLSYNTTTKIATILAPTTINDGKMTMYVTDGYYNTDIGFGSFHKRPIIEDSTQTFTANDIQTDKASGISVATGNMIWRDTAQKVSVLANHGIVNQFTKTVLATRKPVMLLEGKTDTLFVAADTLFSGIVKAEPEVAAAKPDSNVVRKRLVVADSGLALVDSGLVRKRADSSIVRVHVAPPDTNLVKNSGSVPKPLVKADSNVVVTKPVTDSGLARKPLVRADSNIVRVHVAPPDTNLVAIAPIPNGDSMLAKKPLAPRDTTEKRFLIAYNNVRIYSDSLQGVADSVYYSGVDSIFRLYKDPVLWANGNQLTGDTIFLFTKNQKADKLLLDQNALIINEAGPGMYNQIKGNTVLGFFGNEKVDSMYVNGNAENIYYVQDNDSAFISINRLLSAATHIYFTNGELERIVFLKEAEATMYPFTQMPEDQKKLPGFKWVIDRKPKSKYELIGQ